MANEIIGIFLHEDDLVRTTMIPDELDSWYFLLHCDCIDIARRKIGDRVYDIICDDEGLLKERPCTMVSKGDDGQYLAEIVGSIFICNNDGEGNLISLTDDEINNVFECLHGTTAEDKNRMRHVIEINWEG